MTEIFKGLVDLGVLIVITGIFLWEYLTTRKKIQSTIEQNSRMLDEMKNSNKNIHKSLEILQMSMENQKVFLFEHDKRSENIENGIKDISENIKK